MGSRQSSGSSSCSPASPRWGGKLSAGYRGRGVESAHCRGGYAIVVAAAAAGGGQSRGEADWGSRYPEGGGVEHAGLRALLNSATRGGQLTRSHRLFERSNRSNVRMFESSTNAINIV